MNKKARGYSTNNGKSGKSQGSRSNTAKSVTVNLKINGKNAKKGRNYPSNSSSKDSGKQLSIFSSEVPVSYSSKVTVKKPRLGGNGSITINHCELLSDVVTDDNYQGGFSLYSVSVNPGLQRVFPWLSNIARNFQEYRFKSCRVIYISECSTSTTGQIMMTASYDPSLNAPQDETDMSNYEGYVADNVYRSFTFDLNKKGMNSQLHYYIRGTNPNTTNSNIEDIKLLDCANFYYAIDNAPNDSNYLGKLWIDYSVELLRPFTNKGLQQVVTASSIIITGTSVSLLEPFPISGNSIAPSAISGKYGSAGWQSYVGTNTWLSLAGVGSKMIKTNITGTGIGTGLVILLYQYTPNISDDGDIGITQVVTDQIEMMKLADTDLNSFTALTTSKNIIAGQPFALSSGIVGAISYMVNLPPNTLILFKSTSTTITSSAVIITDADFGINGLTTSFGNIIG